MRRKFKATIRRTLVEILLWIVALIVLVPFFLILVNSLKTQQEADLMNLALPESLQLENYAYVYANSDMLRSFFNSLLISTFSVAISTICAALAAFAFSRNRSKINKVLYGAILLGLVLPLNMLPTMQVLKFVGLIGSYAGIILLFSALMIPLAVFLYYGFINNVPRSMDEAALIDGAGGFTLFFRIVLPLLKPVTITVIVINFMNSWNDFLIPLYVLNSSEKWGMILSVYNYYGLYLTSWNYVCTVIMMALLPVILVYIAGQKYIISGMIAGAVKE